MSVANKLTYLNTTKSNLKDMINSTNAGIDNNTTFRNYVSKLYDGYIKVLKDRSILWDGIPKATSTGTITDAVDFQLYEDKMTKLSTQDNTPTPNIPVEVKVVKGFTNLFDKTTSNILSGYVTASSISSASGNRTIYIPVSAGKTYTIQKTVGNAGLRYGFTQATPVIGSQTILDYAEISGKTTTLTAPEGANYFALTIYRDADSRYTISAVLGGLQIVEGSEQYPYVSYGKNYILLTLSDGINAKKAVIPIENYEICGINNYLDELIIDKNGHCWLNKKINKLVLNGTENWSVQNTGEPNYMYYFNPTISPIEEGIGLSDHYEIQEITSEDTNQGLFVGENVIRMRYGEEESITQLETWLSSNNVVVYYPITPQLIDLDYTISSSLLTLYEGNNIITNSENMDMLIKYVKDSY